MKLDNVESAAVLIAVVERHVGRNSETARWVREQLKQGHAPAKIAEALKNDLQRGSPR